MDEKKMNIVNTPLGGHGLTDYRFMTPAQKLEEYKKSIAQATAAEQKKQKTTDQRFSKKQWEIIYVLENRMRTRLTQDITSYVAGSIFDLTEDIHDTSKNPMFIKLNAGWREYVRTKIVPVYPKAKTDKAIRDNLFNLFPSKLYEALENIKRKNEK